MLLLTSHLAFSQSNKYPTQRIENKDTVVVMSKTQADAMNKRFLEMNKAIQILSDKALIEQQQKDSVIKSLTANQLELKVSKAVEHDVWYYSTIASGWFFILAFLTAINH